MASIHSILEEHFLSLGEGEKAAAVRRMAETLWESARAPEPEQHKS